jgi:hypothetical protein
MSLMKKAKGSAKIKKGRVAMPKVMKPRIVKKKDGNRDVKIY